MSERVRERVSESVKRLQLICVYKPDTNFGGTFSSDKDMTFVTNPSIEGVIPRHKVHCKQCQFQSRKLTQKNIM